MKTVTREVEDFCKRVRITLDQFTGDEVIIGNLPIDADITIPPGFAPVVGWNLELSGDTIPEDFAPVVGGFLSLDNVTNIGNGFAPFVGHSLSMKKAASLPEDFRPVVGGYLLLNSVTSIPAGFAPVVRGSVHLFNITSQPENWAPVVGGNLYLEGAERAEVKKLKMTQPLETRGGKYIMAHDRLMEVVSKSGNVWKVRYIGGEQVFYLVMDGRGNFADGETLEEAKESLNYKIMKTVTKEIKDFCKQVGITEAQFMGEEVINGDLIIEKDAIIPPGFAAVIRGCLIASQEIIFGPFKPTLTGSLELKNTTLIKGPFAPLVAGDIHLTSLKSLSPNFTPVTGGKILFPS